ncbi:phosphonate C-P lyase system protein PhnH [Acidovorax sp. SRB_14]|uniref:phosphonate C-P lyase system protein PhnH n=1 Tax=Acidovorax sp. SRB_14 TaxID=1962699 RepID=UPI0015649334|nr:phosphonate C-P lyase system protein PhnH [Acidovorax sp. SRB_14]NMM81386.1 phosphonate C-P lyase system protein PhnH [Acidovorax sp. SRB_14]
MSPTPTTSLAALGAGFSSEALGSQGVFRSVLTALSQPGDPVAIAHDAEVPATGHAASAVVLLALLDSECTLWLSPTLAASQAGVWLRFHTGCVLVDAPEVARFAWVAAGDALPALARLQCGSDEYPDQSATCVIDVAVLAPAVEGSGNWRLTGPGIRSAQHLLVAGLPGDFAAQWTENHGAFPRGVDVVLATATHIAGLPRTTRIDSLSNAEA